MLTAINLTGCIRNDHPRGF